MTALPPRPPVPSNLPLRRKNGVASHDPFTNLVPAAATSSSAQPSRQSTPLLPSSSPPPLSSSTTVDSALDPAAILLIRRTLCVHQASQRSSSSHGDYNHSDRASPRQIEHLLPLMTSSREVDLELYAILAAVVRDHVSPWYTKITPDGEFVDEVVKIIAHVVRALEERAKKLDLEDLLLNEIPGVLNAHVVAYRTAVSHQTPSSLPNSRLNIYHALSPHPALSPVPDPSNPAAIEDQKQNERAYRLLLVQDLLRILLPPEDLENDCLRTLVEEILSETVLGNLAIGKGSQGWVWWMGVGKVAEMISQRRRGKVAFDGNGDSSTGGPPTRPTTVKRSYEMFTASLSSLFYTFLHILLAIFTTLRFIIIALITFPSLPHRSSAAPSTTSRPSSQPSPGPTSQSFDSAPKATPILASQILTTASLLLSLDKRKPWLRGSLQLLQHLLLSGPGRVGASDGVLDRYLSRPLHPLTHPLPTTILPPLRTLRLLLQHPQPTVPPPSRSQQRSIKRHTAASLLSLLPLSVRRAWLGTADADAQVKEVETGMLDVFGGGGTHEDDGENVNEAEADAEGRYMLKGLVFHLLDLLVARAVPELAVRASEAADAKR